MGLVMKDKKGLFDPAMVKKVIGELLTQPAAGARRVYLGDGFIDRFFDCFRSPVSTTSGQEVQGTHRAKSCQQP